MSTLVISKRLQSIGLIVFISAVAVAGLLLLMRGLSGSEEISSTANHPAMPQQPVPQPVESHASSSNVSNEEPIANDEVVATVNERAITNQVWQQATLLDAAMSRLVAQPIPTGEETLDRLINEIIVLDGTKDIPIPTDADIESRILALMAAWDVTEELLVSALDKVGLERADLAERINRLIQVETALNQLAEREEDVDTWLIQARASAEIGLYRALVNTTPLPATELLGEVSPTLQPVSQIPAAEIENPAPKTQNPKPKIQNQYAPPADMAVSPYPQNAAPDFTLPQLNHDDSLTLSNFRGKPTLINFWATWCPPCRRELPALQAAYTAHSEEIEFVAVDVKESPDVVAPFIESMGLTFPIALDQSGDVSNVAYEVRGLPTTVFVDANGVVAARHVGPLDEAAIDNYLSPLLAPAQTTVALESGQDETSVSMTTVDTQDTGSMSSSQQNLTGNFPAASNFTLTAASGTQVSLQNYQGKSNVVLVFYRGHT